MVLPTTHPLVSGKTRESKIVLALTGKPQTTPPIWLMRQAGRSLPEYRKLREGIPMLESCLRPELAAEITMQPVRRHKVDAGILFSDIVIPLKLAGLDVSIVPNVGPVLNSPIQSRNDFAKLQMLDPLSLQPIIEAVSIATEELGATPLLGFGGAPFTLASYLIEGRPSQEIPISRQLMATDSDLWNEILNWCALITADFLRAQIMAGVSGIQIFDSWAGRLTREEYILYAAPHLKTVLNQISDLPVPKIAFGVGTKSILKDMQAAGATVMGIDSHTLISEAVEILGDKIPLQGNIDPELLLGPWDQLRAATDRAIEEGGSALSHVLNLGHGVLPNTDPDAITRLVSYVHESDT